MKRNFITLSLVLAAAGMVLNASAQEKKMGDELIANGGFETLDDLTGEPVGWIQGDPEQYLTDQSVSVETEGAKEGKNFVTITTPQQQGGIFYSEAVEIPYQWLCVPNSAGNVDYLENYANISFWLKGDQAYLDMMKAGMFPKVSFVYYDISSVPGGVLTTTYTSPFAIDNLVPVDDIKADEWFHISVSPKENGEDTFSLIDITRPLKIKMVFEIFGGKCSVDDIHVSITEKPVSGIDGVSTSTVLPVKAEGNTLYVAANAGEQIRVFSVDGAQVATTAAVQGTTRIDNLPKGLLLVKAGKQTAKVMLK